MRSVVPVLVWKKRNKNSAAEFYVSQMEKLTAGTVLERHRRAELTLIYFYLDILSEVLIIKNLENDFFYGGAKDRYQQKLTFTSNPDAIEASLKLFTFF